MKTILFIVTILLSSIAVFADYKIQQDYRKADCAFDTKEKCVVIYTHIIDSTTIVWSDTSVALMPDLNDILVLNKQKATEYMLSLSDYCDGWKDGYCEGWKDVKGQFAICPVAPVCPVPYVNCNTYTCGYNRGFKAGMKKAYD